MNKQYYPGNGSEGEWFMSKYCNHCVNHDSDYETNKKTCSILAKSLFDPVIEWINGIDGPVCTNYKYHDWSEGEPDTLDPNQLELFEMEEQQ